ncbi:hypothetical protein Q5752_000205 [Cryptotrichosporon argae]
MSTPAISPSERAYIHTGLAHPTKPTRADGRGLLDSRAIGVSYGEAPHAAGSARVRVGGTEVLAGVRLEVEDGDGRCRVEVDVTPQAFPHLSSASLSTMSTQLAALLADHLVPSVALLPVLPPKHFTPYLHLTVLSFAGSLPTCLFAAARTALVDLAVPRTKVIGWEGDAEAGIEHAGQGIKGAVGVGAGKAGRAKARVRGADDWELDDGESRLLAREALPVLVVLNLVDSTDTWFLDADEREEMACPNRVLVAVNGSGRICGMRIEGESGVEAARIRPLLEEAKRVGLELIKALNEDMPE